MCPFLSSGQKRYNDPVELQLRYGAYVDTQEGEKKFNSTLHLAVQAGQSKMMQYILSQGVNLEVRDVMGNRMLYEAPRREKLAIVQHLLKRGADFGGEKQ